MMKRLSLRGSGPQQSQPPHLLQQPPAALLPRPASGVENSKNIATGKGVSDIHESAKKGSKFSAPTTTVRNHQPAGRLRLGLVGRGRGTAPLLALTRGSSSSSASWNEESSSSSSSSSLPSAAMPCPSEGGTGKTLLLLLDGDDDDDAATRTTAAETSSFNSASTTQSTLSCRTGELALRNRRHTPSFTHWKPAPSLVGAVEQWIHATHQVFQSDELQLWMATSQHVLGTASTVAVKAALFLPVTLPLAVTQTVVGGCCHAAAGATALVLQLVLPHHLQQQQKSTRLLREWSSTTTETNAPDPNAVPPLASEEDSDDSAEETADEELGNSPPGAAFSDDADSKLVAHVLGVPWMLIHAANRVKDDLGSLVVNAVAPPSMSQPLPPPSPAPTTPDNFAIRKGKLLTDGDDDCEQDRFLDRLRLDYAIDTPLVKSYSQAPSSEKAQIAKRDAPPSPNAALAATTVQGPDQPGHSKFLLPVHDLGLVTDEGQPLCFVDLQHTEKSALHPLVTQALQRLVEVGVAWMANHPTVRLSRQVPPPKLSIEWKPESHTPKILKKMAPLSTLERLRVLEREVLIWSGALSGAKFPFFLARGVVPQSPTEFMRMLWDNNRTVEYNNFCLGRTTLLVLHDGVLSDDSPSKAERNVTGTKVVQSETRVPFTSLSVLVSCAMHVQPLEAPDEGFVIVSRSVYTGPAGTHCNSSPHGVEPASKNEILWGMNILRRVPNHPHLTDLTSLSQVGSTLVPKFLATRIGLMGIEDFFKNVRTPKAAATAGQPSTAR